jgi:hypothetical protein
VKLAFYVYCTPFAGQNHYMPDLKLKGKPGLVVHACNPALGDEMISSAKVI